jgi:hypothetical protein
VFFVGYQVMSNACATFDLYVETKTQDPDSKTLFSLAENFCAAIEGLTAIQATLIFYQMIKT